MAQTVVLKTDCLHVKKGGIELHVAYGKEKSGTLAISNGKIEWFPRNKQKGISLKWAEFAELMQGYAKEGK